MKIYRVVDYDFSGSFIVLHTFIDFVYYNVGINVTTEGNYYRDINENFDVNYIEIKKQIVDEFIGPSNYDEFKNTLENWWKEPDKAYQIFVKQPDKFLLNSLIESSKTIIREIYKQNEYL